MISALVLASKPVSSHMHACAHTQNFICNAEVSGAAILPGSSPPALHLRPLSCVLHSPPPRNGRRRAAPTPWDQQRAGKHTSLSPTPHQPELTLVLCPCWGRSSSCAPRRIRTQLGDYMSLLQLWLCVLLQKSFPILRGLNVSPIVPSAMFLGGVPFLNPAGAYF